ncbi:MAG: hypothetical protein NVSMB51_10440 [Solirubrobacteraceae bacterium]
MFVCAGMLGGVAVSPAPGSTLWHLQYAGDQNNFPNLYGVSFVDSYHGWAVGYNGRILATSDGRHWGAQSSGTTNALNGVSFADSGHGWAVGDGGTILATSDGGASWSAQSSGTSAKLRGVKFVDSSHGWAVGDGTILATSDGGASWSAQSSGGTGTLRGVSFVDASHGAAVGDGFTILYTSDGGATWGDYAGASVTASLLGVSLVDSSHGWAVGGGGTIVHTNTGFQGGTIQASGTTRTLLGVSAVDADRAWAVGANGTILVTSDGGAHWSPQNSGSPYDLYGVSAVDTDHAWAVGDFGIFASPAGDDFSIGANPTSLTVAQGASADSTISTAVTSGSAQNLDLSASGVPSGASVSFNPASIMGDGSSTMTVNAGTAAPGTYPITVTGTGPYAQHTTSVTLTVTAPVVVSPGSLPDGTVNTPYDQVISASGGSGPYTYAVGAGALPDGLSLDPNSGELSGTPTTPGDYAFTVIATDANGATGSQDYTPTINDQIVLSPDLLPMGVPIRPMTR